MTPDQAQRRDDLTCAALTGLLSGVTLSDHADVRDAQLKRISAEAVEVADATLARLNRTALYPVTVINPKDEAAINNARTG